MCLRVRSVLQAVHVIVLGAGALAFGCASSDTAAEAAETRNFSLIQGDFRAALPAEVASLVSVDVASPASIESIGSVVRGALLFFDRDAHGLGGNGRACSDCHMPTDSFQLSPADVEARFQALQARRRLDPRADDALFRPIDADDFRINGDRAEDYGNLRENGLIRISFPLPPNIKLIDPATGTPSAETIADVWRAVPTVNNVKLTGPQFDLPPWPCAEGGPPGPPCVPREPNPFGGYQLDGRFEDLQAQAFGAFSNHAQVTRDPSQRMLDDLANFQNELFSSLGVRAASRALDAGVTPEPDPDPPLNQLEREGKVVFTRACGQCHGGAPASLGIRTIERYGTIQAQCPRPVDGPAFPGYAGTPRFEFPACPPRLARNVRVYEITLPNGTKIRRPSSDPGRTLTSGVFIGTLPKDDWQAFDFPSVRGISKTAPYFHNNSAATLEEMLDHYSAFFKFVEAVAPLATPAGVPLPRPVPISTDGIHIDRPFTPEERPGLLAYLRKI